MAELELGLNTFGDVTTARDGTPVPQPQVIRNVVEQAVLADEVGVDFFGVGEHHRADFAVSAPEIVLGRQSPAGPERIRLGSAVTVLSSDDPVRVFQRFATLDAVSERSRRGHPRARFVHRVVPAVRVRPVRLRHAVRGEGGAVRGVAQRAAGDLERDDARSADQGVGVPAHRLRRSADLAGRRRQPESVVRAARYGFGLALAIIGGEPERFAPYVDLFHRALDQLGTGPAPIAIHSGGHIADTDEQAKDELWPHHRD